MKQYLTGMFTAVYHVLQVKCGLKLKLLENRKVELAGARASEASLRLTARGDVIDVVFT